MPGAPDAYVVPIPLGVDGFKSAMAVTECARKGAVLDQVVTDINSLITTATMRNLEVRPLHPFCLGLSVNKGEYS